ncbi:glutamate receptor 1.2 [Striga asiatica]|uniref:Glutamate receptor n=1 Tax=Striga asiatica TaxID=4170 RepID=A0A5A7PG80_STRAF|nr:glutamate receptor 1.2 [Striga asiatica]
MIPNFEKIECNDFVSMVSPRIPMLRVLTISVYFVFTIFLLILFGCFSISSARTENVNVGALINYDSRIGKEMKTALKLAGQKFNKSSNRAFLHFKNPRESPIEALYAAEELVKEKNAQFIVSTGTWAETALVATYGNRTKVPIISFAGPTIEKSIVEQQWPFLVHIFPDTKQQIKCIADIITTFHWRKVVAIYEVDDSGAFSLLSDALSAVGVEIEHRLVLPPFSSLSDPNTFVRQEAQKLLTKQARVFVVLKTSLEMSVVLFKEANELGLVQKDSAWIISDPLAGLLDSVNSSVISSMEGSIGVTTHFSENGRLFREFKQNFRRIFRSDYPEEDNFEPSVFALRVYDVMNAIIMAAKKSNSGESNLEALLSTDFAGLSGRISFDGGELIVQPFALKIVNVVGKKYKEVGILSSNTEERPVKWYEFDLINWPGDLRRVPKGWSMPNEAKPLRIGVPGRTSFEKFVKVTGNSSIHSYSYSGFCIDIFFEVVKIVENDYPLPYEFVPFLGTYDELVNCVANKTFDAVVGDVTILANRSSFVEFTQPFTESGLTMLVTVNSRARNTAWIFIKPFSGGMWAVTGAVFLYTVLIVWLLEREMNPEFEGPWWNQLNTALWFTCCSLFFAHREKVYNNYTRIVVLVWLFVVLVLTSSYTASLSSLLTVPRITPSISEIQLLKDQNAKIGCDGDSFVRKYLENVLGFHPDNIRTVDSEYKYPKEFETGNISAAFLELPYQKAFLNHYCTGYTVSGNTSSVAGDRFGGLGFVFQKGSPITEDVSRAILTLSENGKLKELELEYISPTRKCVQNADMMENLSWESFWALFIFSVGTSAICYLLFSVHQLYEQWHRE